MRPLFPREPQQEGRWGKKVFTSSGCLHRLHYQTSTNIKHRCVGCNCCAFQMSIFQVSGKWWNEVCKKWNIPIYVKSMFYIILKVKCRCRRLVDFVLVWEEKPKVKQWRKYFTSYDVEQGCGYALWSEVAAFKHCQQALKPPYDSAHIKVFLEPLLHFVSCMHWKGKSSN